MLLCSFFTLRCVLSNYGVDQRTFLSVNKFLSTDLFHLDFIATLHHWYILMGNNFFREKNSHFFLRNSTWKMVSHLHLQDVWWKLISFVKKKPFLSFHQLETRVQRNPFVTRPGYDNYFSVCAYLHFESEKKIKGFEWWLFTTLFIVSDLRHAIRTQSEIKMKLFIQV